MYALKAYKNHDRNAGLVNIMQQQAASLTDADINALADYYPNIK